MKYIIENTDRLDEEFMKRAVPYLSLQRLRSLDKMRVRQDRLNSAVVYLMLRYALKKEYGITDAPEFTFGERGKPYLEKGQPFFNLSHCRNACACIVSDQENGCDISDKRLITSRTAGYFCSKEELDEINGREDMNDLLLRAWTVKECYSKLDGRGLLMDLRNIPENKLSAISCYTGERYFAAFTGKSEEKPEIITAEDIFSVL